MKKEQPVVDQKTMSTDHTDTKQDEETELSPVEQCVICLEELGTELTDSSSSVYRSRCGHVTHTHCLHASIRSGNYTCPLCRNSLGDISAELAAVDSRINRYVKMLKSGLAPQAVRQRMVVDAIPVTLIDAFFTGGASRAVDDGTDAPPETPSDAEVIAGLVAKYQKMLDMGMPEGAVRQKVLASAAPEPDKTAILTVLFR